MSIEYEKLWKYEIQKDLFKDNSSSTPISSVFPKLWQDLDGNVNQTVYRACLETVIQLIFDRPGIYDTKIIKQLEQVMTPAEVQEICDDLVNRGCCIREYYKKKEMCSILDGLFGNMNESYGMNKCTGILYSNLRI